MSGASGGATVKLTRRANRRERTCFTTSRGRNKTITKHFITALCVCFCVRRTTIYIYIYYICLCVCIYYIQYARWFYFPCNTLFLRFYDQKLYRYNIQVRDQKSEVVQCPFLIILSSSIYTRCVVSRVSAAVNLLVQVLPLYKILSLSRRPHKTNTYTYIYVSVCIGFI